MPQAGTAGPDAMLNIFEYLSYAAYLRDYYELRKRQNSFFSYRYMGKVLDMDPGFLVKVTQGKVSLPERAIPAVAKLCKLKDPEARYFEALVHYGRAKTPQEIKLHFEKLIALRGLESRPLEVSQYAYYQKWHHSAIRSLLTFHDFRGDYADLAARVHPPVTLAEAEESVRLLIELGIVAVGPDGRHRVVGPPLTTGEKWRTGAVRDFQLEAMRLAERSLREDPKQVRDISTVTVAVRFSDLEEIRTRIRELRQSIMHMMADSGDPDCVYQLNFQVFPLSKVDHLLAGAGAGGSADAAAGALADEASGASDPAEASEAGPTGAEAAGEAPADDPEGEDADLGGPAGRDAA